MVRLAVLNFKAPTLHTHFAVDAMYFQAAQSSFEQGVQAERKVDRARHKHEVLIDRAAAIRDAHHGDEVGAYDELEPIYIRMESTAYNVGAAWAPALRAFSITHICCAAALESHVNIRAEDLLAGFLLKKFNKLDIESKWVLLPKMLGLEGFDVGDQPFQGLTQLVRFRNQLVHYRDRSEPWVDPGVPGFLGNLGLTREAANQSIECVRKMIAALATLLKQEPPYWLGLPLEKISYFYIK